MLEGYKILQKGGVGELVEKKSKFIATTYPVSTEEEAITFIEATKKKYWNASHNCTAYIIGENYEIQRCSDDGEPSGTAGRPMLDVLLGEEVRNIVVVVTRYFGGTLLGTGGLVRAYSKAVSEGLKDSVIIEKRLGIHMIVKVDYVGIGKLQYIAAGLDVTVLDTRYEEDVEMEMLVPINNVEELKEKIMEFTNGRGEIHDLGKKYYNQDVS
ncbi:MAG: YigZ family protein [Clostridiales bacterium]|nr:YigZ family protein [Clostridiales bacterium]